MYVWMNLHLGHTDDRRGYWGLVEARCNMRAAAMRSNPKNGRVPVPGLVLPKIPKGRRPW